MPMSVAEWDDKCIAAAVRFNVHARKDGVRHNRPAVSLDEAAQIAREMKSEGMRPLVYAIGSDERATFVNPDKYQQKDGSK